MAAAHVGQHPYPEQRQRDVEFVRLAGALREGADRRTHARAGLLDTRGLLQVGPGQAQVLAVVKVPRVDLAAVEAGREIGVGFGVRFGAVHV